MRRFPFHRRSGCGKMTENAAAPSARRECAGEGQSMEYQNIIRGTFLSRPNRFIAMVAIG